MATMIYTGAGNTANWSDPNNWKRGVAPGAADTARLEGGAASVVTAPVAVNSIMLLGPQSVTFNGRVQTYGVGACKGLMVCDGGIATFAAGSALVDGGVLQVGVNAVGTLYATGTAANGVTLASGNASIGKDVGGVGTVSLQYTSWSIARDAFVGKLGHGTLDVGPGTHVVVAGNLLVGHAAGATGVLALSGPESTVSASAIFVGGAAPGSGVGTVSVGAGSLLDSQGMLHVGVGSALTLAGGTVSAGDKTSGLVVGAGGTVSGYGLVATRPGGGVVLEGAMEAKGGVLEVQGGLRGHGTLTIDADSVAQIDGASVHGTHIMFAGPGASLSLAHGAAVTGELDGFSWGDAIRMAGIDQALWNASTGVLTLGSAGQVVDQLHLGGNYAGDVFAVSQQSGVGVIMLQHAA